MKQRVVIIDKRIPYKNTLKDCNILSMVVMIEKNMKVYLEFGWFESYGFVYVCNNQSS